MKAAEPALDPVSPPARRTETSRLTGAAEDRFEPRYVELPALRERGYGRRNLLLGSLLVIFALALLAVAVFLAGGRAVLTLATCLVTFTSLFVLARLHIFRQRNGVFLGIAFVCLLGSLIPLLERAFFSLAEFSRTAHAASAPAGAAIAAVRAPDGDVMLLTQAFALAAPEAAGAPLVNVLRDSRILIENRPYLIKAGDRFPYIQTRNGEVTFAVRDLQIALPSQAVEVLMPATKASSVATADAFAPAAANETPAQVTQRAIQETIRRYPALGVKDSLENQAFLSVHREFKQNGGDEFFADAQWPIALAEFLAKREGWKRGAPATFERPSTTSEGPAEAAREPGADRNMAPSSNLPLDGLSPLEPPATAPSEPPMKEPQVAPPALPLPE